MMNGLKQYSQWHPELRSGFRLLLIVCLGLGAWVLWQEQALWSKKLVASQQELQQRSVQAGGPDPKRGGPRRAPRRVVQAGRAAATVRAGCAGIGGHDEDQFTADCRDW